MRRKKPIIIIAVILAMLLAVLIIKNSALAPGGESDKEIRQNSSEIKSLDKNQYSKDDPSSPWVVVNKLRPLSPIDYVPADLTTPNIALRSSGAEMQLRKTPAAQVQKMFAAASKENISLILVSGYRSYQVQQVIYSGYVSSEGQASADSQSARPGHSEHQTGLAADIGNLSGECQLVECFSGTAGGKWLANNAHKYGFIVRYPQDSRDKVGYIYEPWHFRYVGKDLATELKRSGQTLEQYFGFPNAPDYN